jgi:hypothetical protein
MQVNSEISEIFQREPAIGHFHDNKSRTPYSVDSDSWNLQRLHRTTCNKYQNHRLAHI